MLIHPAQQQKLHPTAGRDLASVQARRDDARLVQYEQVAGTQVATQVVKDGVLHSAAVPRQHQQA